LPVLTAQLREFLPLGGGQPVVTHTCIATGLCDPVVDGYFCPSPEN
jgi:hypothetical protein